MAAVPAAEQAAFARPSTAHLYPGVLPQGESGEIAQRLQQDLQLWVGACLMGRRRIYHFIRGDGRRDRRPALSDRGTRRRPPLCRCPKCRPADRAAFEQYWQGVRWTDPHRRRGAQIPLSHRAVNRVGQAPAPRAAAAATKFWLLATTGSCRSASRDGCKLPWDPQHQAQFDRLISIAPPTICCRARCGVPVQRPAARDLDWRIRTGRPWCEAWWRLPQPLGQRAVGALFTFQTSRRPEQPC